MLGAISDDCVCEDKQAYSGMLGAAVDLLAIAAGGRFNNAYSVLRKVYVGRRTYYSAFYPRLTPMSTHFFCRRAHLPLLARGF